MLDTNAYSGLMRGEEWAANEVRAANHIYIPAVVMGELLYGFRLGKRNSENRRQLSEFLALRHADFHPSERCEYIRISSVHRNIEPKRKHEDWRRDSWAWPGVQRPNRPRVEVGPGLFIVGGDSKFQPPHFPGILPR